MHSLKFYLTVDVQLLGHHSNGNFVYSLLIKIIESADTKDMSRAI